MNQALVSLKYTKVENIRALWTVKKEKHICKNNDKKNLSKVRTKAKLSDKAK